VKFEIYSGRGGLSVSLSTKSNKPLAYI
jgi:hypothetical protein